MKGKVAAIILAAGKGVRMNSDLPKVLQKLDKEPLINHVLKTVYETGIRDVYVVVGHKADLVKRECKKFSKINFIYQKEQLGTGHAVMQVEPELNGNFDTILVLNGDTPFIRAETLKEIIEVHRRKKLAATLLTSEFPDPKGYGRIIRKEDGEVVKIVEEKDGRDEELAVKEINTGTYCFNKDYLFSALREIKPENKQGEYYLTDTVEVMQREKLPIFASKIETFEEVLGVNTKNDFNLAQDIHKRRKVMSHPVHLAKKKKVIKGIADVSYLALSGVVKNG